MFSYLLCGSLLLGGSFVAAWVKDRFGSWVLGTGAVLLLMLSGFLFKVASDDDKAAAKHAVVFVCAISCILLFGHSLIAYHHGNLKSAARKKGEAFRRQCEWCQQQTSRCVRPRVPRPVDGWFCREQRGRLWKWPSRAERSENASRQGPPPHCQPKRSPSTISRLTRPQPTTRPFLQSLRVAFDFLVRRSR